jgi:hypothetical protein
VVARPDRHRNTTPPAVFFPAELRFVERLDRSNPDGRDFQFLGYQDSGMTVVASDSSHLGIIPARWASYTARVSVISSNGVSLIDGSTLANGTP